MHNIKVDFDFLRQSGKRKSWISFGTVEVRNDQWRTSRRAENPNVAGMGGHEA